MGDSAVSQVRQEIGAVAKKAKVKIKDGVRP